MKRLIFVFSSVFILLICLLSPGINLKIEEVYSSINGLRIFIDPGHGGYDPGTNYDIVLEKDINFKIASFLYEEVLSSSGIPFITRTGDYDLASISSSNHKMEDLKTRVKIINESGADLLISLHLNAINDKSIFGPMVYYRSKDEVSKSFATSIQDSLNKFTGLNKIIHEERYYLFRKTFIPAVLIECGFLSNKEERNRLLDRKYQEDIAKAIIRGINIHFNS